ncbi:MAG TPA: copper resistance protein CopC [Gaiellaceae bacterium]|nr:copper resistance protein CopC [Gaiellaceae bacterium]
MTRRLLVVLLVALAVPAAASAHAFVVRTVPADRAVSPTPPREVLVEFNSPVSVGSGNAVIRDGGGSVLGGAARVHGKTLVLPLLTTLSNGNYSVRWSVISDDGHPEQGVLAFGVGSGPPPTSTLRANTHVSVVTVLTRWLFLSALLITAGLALFDLVVSRIPLRWLAPGEAVVAATAAALVYESGAGLSTRFALAVSAAGLVALLGVAVGTVAPDWLLRAVALAPLAVPTLAGHALDAGRSWIDAPVDFLHVLGVAFWLGSLVALAVIVQSREAMHRFSRFAVVAVLLIAATGIGSALAELRSFSQLWTTGYGESILVKSGLFAAALALAWASRSRLTATSIRAEVVVVLGVVAAVGVLTSLPPGKTAHALASAGAQSGIARLPASDAVVLGQRDGSFAAALAVRPSGDAMATFVATDAKAVDVGPVTISGRPTTSCGVGCYSGTAPASGVVTVTHGAVSLRFDFGTPSETPELAARIGEVYRHSRSVVYDQQIATSLAAPTNTRWVEVAPDEYSYRIKGGPEAIVIGTRRWDRTPGSAWKRSTTVAEAWTTPWGYGPITNAHLLRQEPRTFVVSFFGASLAYPAWFTAVVDRRTLRLVRLQMTAAAHFMHVRYVSWNKDITLKPPNPG